MNKILKILIPVIILAGIIVISIIINSSYRKNTTNDDIQYGCDEKATPNSKSIEKLYSTKEIIIGDKSTTNKEDIYEIITILSSAKGQCDITTTEMYTYTLKLIDNLGKTIDTVYVWLNRVAIKSDGMYYLSKEDIGRLLSNIEKITGTKLFNIIDETEICAEALELIYEDSGYKYYFSCIKSSTVFIEFISNHLKLTVKEALEKGNITIKELLDVHPDLFIKMKNIF